MKHLRRFNLKVPNGEKTLASKLHYPDGLRVVLFASGRGSNAQVLMELSKKLTNFHIVAVATDHSNAPVVHKANEYGIDVIINEKVKGQSKLEYEALWVEKLSELSHHMGLLCGYMKILGPTFLNYYWCSNQSIYKLINIHPSLLPAYPGLDAYRRAFENRDSISGVTLHLVDEEVDSGAILMQESFERVDDEAFESFEQRGLKLEHILFPKLIQKILTEGVEI